MPTQRGPTRGVCILTIAIVAITARAICLSALLARLPFYRSTAPGFDQHTYYTWAQAIAAGDVLSRTAPGSSAGLHTPGLLYFAPLYPYVLAPLSLLTGGHLLVAGIVLNAALGVLTALAAGGIARRFFGGWAGLIAGLLVALNGVHISVEGMLLHDSLIAFLLVGGFYLVIRAIPDPWHGHPAHADDATVCGPGGHGRDARATGWRGAYWLLPGVALGLACVGRTTNVLVVAGLCAWLLLRSRRVGPSRGLAAAALALSAGVVFALPVVRNGLIGGQWTPPTGGWATMFLGITPDAPGTLDYTPRYEQAADRARRADDKPAAWRREVLRVVREDPAGVARTIGRHALALTNSWDAPDNGNYYFVRRYVRPFGWTIGPVVLYALGLAGLAIGLRQVRRFAPLYIFAATLAISILPAYPSGRFRLALLCALAIFGGYAVAVGAGLLRKRRCWGGAAVIALIGLTTLASWPRGPWGHTFAQNTLRENEFSYHATALLTAGRRDEAVAMLADADRLWPGTRSRVEALCTREALAQPASTAVAALDDVVVQYPRSASALAARAAARIRLAGELDSVGSRDDAATERERAFDDLTKAIEIEPRTVTLRLSRSAVAILLDRADAALADTAAAIELEPQSAVAHCRRGQAHRCAGRLSEALSALNRAIELDGELADAYRSRAGVYTRLNRPELARQDTERARELERGFSPP